MKATVEFVGADQNWKSESTSYWFMLYGQDSGTEVEFDGDVYGVVESGIDSQIVNEDGYPITPGDDEYIAVQNTIGPMQQYRERA